MSDMPNIEPLIPRLLRHALSNQEAEQVVALLTQLAALRAVLKDCADELSEWVEAHYAGTKDYPGEARRYERDIASVKAARAILNTTETTS